jgi:hypothetical protein
MASRSSEVTLSAALEIERQISVEQLAKVERESKEVQGQLDAAEAKAAVLGETAAAQLPDIEARLVQLYKMGRAGYWRLLLRVDDVQAIGRTYRTVSTLNAIERASTSTTRRSTPWRASARRCRSAPRSSRRSQPRPHARAPPPTGPSRRGRRWSTRSTPAAISTLS